MPYCSFYNTALITLLAFISSTTLAADVEYYNIYILIGLSFLFGVMAVIPIGGADMPVVISLLNSYSGLAACAAGFAINNNILIVAGSLVGATGIILTNIMCKPPCRNWLHYLMDSAGWRVYWWVVWPCISVGIAPSQ